MKTPPWNERIELDEIFRKLYLEEHNATSLDTEKHILNIKVWQDWVYEEGGWITIEWDLNYEFLDEQKQEVQDEIKKYLFSAKEIKTE